MTTKPLFIKLLGLLLICSVLTNCKTHDPGTWRNEQIEPGDREDFHKLNTQLMAALKANNHLQMDGLMSADLIQRPGKLRLIELCSNHLKDGAYSLLNEFYMVNDEHGNKMLKTNNYTLDYNAETREMYIAFFTPKDISNQYIISAIYCKYNYGWKLSHLEVNPYTYNGKTAPELFDQAKNMMVKGYFIDALADLQLAATCANPCEGWQYTGLADMRKFNVQLANALNEKYKYPLTLTQVPTRPRIFSISTQTTPSGVYPLIYYISSIKLKNTDALKKENDEIKEVIGKLVPGIDKDKKFVYYDAFNEYPRYDQSVDRVDFVDKLK